MPISIAPLAQRDLDAMFSDMRERAGVNALFPFMYSHERTAPGSCRKAVASVIFNGGNYARPHMEFYKDTPLTLQDMSARSSAAWMFLEKIIPVAKKHGSPRVSIFTRRQFAARRREKLGIALTRWIITAAARWLIQAARALIIRAYQNSRSPRRGLARASTTSAASVGFGAAGDC